MSSEPHAGSRAEAGVDGRRSTVGSAVRGIADFARAFAVAVPPALIIAWTATGRDLERPWAALGAALAVSAVLAWSGRAALRRRLQTVANVLASYREGDFSIRARAAAPADLALRDVLAELNQLGETLRQHRLGEMEAWALLKKVLAEVDVVVLALDGEGKVRLANGAAVRVLGKPAAVLVGQRASDLELGDLLAGPAPRVVKGSPALGARPWELRRGGFRLSGEPHTLVVLSDVSSAQRDSERDAWRRLIRVMGHEINNSLAPIRSMSESLLAELERPPPRAETFERDLAEALGVIARRSEALGRFTAGYAKLAKLPPPSFAPIALGPLVDKVALLERRMRVEVRPGPDVTIPADVDQLEQVLINLIKNAADAASTTQGGVRVGWNATETAVEIAIEDDGPGIADTANLFVPFFTTKPDGSGIGLLLCREIVEAHNGQLAVSRRPNERGTIATVRLPFVRSQSRRDPPPALEAP